MCNLICGESAATEKVPCCFSLIVKRTTAISRKRKQCPMSPQRRDKDKDAFNSPKSAGQNKRISICTFITINREFQIRLSTRRWIHCESQTNEDNLPHEWKAYETQPSTDASRMRHFFSLVWVFFPSFGRTWWLDLRVLHKRSICSLTRRKAHWQKAMVNTVTKKNAFSLLKY